MTSTDGSLNYGRGTRRYRLLKYKLIPFDGMRGKERKRDVTNGDNLPNGIVVMMYRVYLFRIYIKYYFLSFIAAMRRILSLRIRLGILPSSVSVAFLQI